MYPLSLNFLGSESGSKLVILDALDYSPFPVKRIFMILNCSKGEKRGCHSHLECWQGILVIRGSISVKTIHKNRTSPDYSYLFPGQVMKVVPHSTWLEIDILEDKTDILVLASHHFLESDYIRDFQKFLES